MRSMLTRSLSAIVAVVVIMLGLYRFSLLNKERTAAVLPLQSLTVVGVGGATTYYTMQGYAHGLGYSLVRGFASTQAQSVKLIKVGNPHRALKLLSTNSVQLMLVSDGDIIHQLSAHYTAHHINCNHNSALTRYGLSPDTYIISKTNTPHISQTLSTYLCNQHSLIPTEFYQYNFIQQAQQSTKFQTTKRWRLRLLAPIFKLKAWQYDLDWRLLAAQAYQESYLLSDITSPTGVTGIMMLTQRTADELGVPDRTSTWHSIDGGARYMRKLLTQFDDAPMPDRYWIALAAYNMGPTAMTRTQAQVARMGNNAHSWDDIYSYMQHHASQGQYQQAMDYVTRIRGIYQLYTYG